MRTRHLAAIAALAGFLALAPGVSAQAGDVARGAEAYGDTCGRCHNPRSPVERSDRDWIIIVNHMRARGAGLTGQQVRDILAFLQASNNTEPVAPQGAAAAPQQPFWESIQVSRSQEDIDAGRALASQKGCIGCHVIGGTGGAIGPALAGVVAAKGATFVAHKLAQPSFNNEGTLMPNLGLTEDQVRALVAYLATLEPTP